MLRTLVLRVESAQQITELLTSMLGATAAVVDRDLTLLADTAPARGRPAYRRSADLYVNCMRTGLPAWRPPESDGGRDSGEGAPLVACPVLVDGDAAGAIALIPRNAEQEAALRGQGRSVADLLSVVAGLLAGAASAQLPEPPGLITSPECMRAALDSLPDGIVAVDHRGIVLYCNRTALDKLMAEMDLTGQPLVHWYPPAADRRFTDHDEVREVTFDRRGRRLRLLEAINPLRHGDRVIGRLLVLRDVASAGAIVQPSHPTLAEAERQLIGEVVARYGMSGDGKREAARALGLSLATLYRKLRQYGISPSPEAGTQRFGGRSF